MPIFLAALVDSADEPRFTAIYNRYGDRLLRLANAYLHDPMLAEDAFQEAFIRFAKGLQRMRNKPDEFLYGALKALVRFSALNILTREKRELQLPENFDAPSPDETGAENVADIIVRLPDGIGHLLILRHVYGYTVNELAEMQRVSTDKIYRQLRRGRTLLEKELGEHTEEETAK